VIATIIPGEVLLSVNGAIIIALVYLARVIALLRERVARLEEWIRVHEKERE